MAVPRLPASYGVTRWWRGDGQTSELMLGAIRLKALNLGLEVLQLDASGIRVTTLTDAEQRGADELDVFLRKAGELV